MASSAASPGSRAAFPAPFPTDRADSIHLLEERFKMGQAYSSPWPDFLLYVSGPKPPASFDSSLAAAYASPRTSSNHQPPPQPHAFLVAEQAYETLLSHQRSQAIILTGECGSGKTQNARLITAYLTHRSTDAAEARIGSLLSHADALLDAFGCAHLGGGNTHASRFERETILHYSTGGRLVGATLNVFGLEERRAACRPPTERNFNIFYQLLAGAPASALHQRHLLAPAAHAAVPDDFAILRHRAAHDALPAPEAAARAVHGPDSYLGLLPPALLRHCFTYAHTDAAGYARTTAAMEALGISADEQRQVNQIMSALLLIGNVNSFQSTEAANTLATAATLMGLTNYEASLTAVAAQGANGGETILTGGDSLLGRDSLLSRVYCRLFTWLVGRINAALDAPVTEARDALLAIRVVDPAGFCASQNTLTQMLYNYATDKLHATLLAHELALQRCASANIGLQWGAPNTHPPVVALFERGNGGIFQVLDAQSASPAGSESALFAQLRPCISNTSIASPGASPGSFMVRHSMGCATYQLGDWLSQNTATPNALLAQTLLASSLSVVRGGLALARDPHGRQSRVSSMCTRMHAVQNAASQCNAYTVLCIRATRGGNSRGGAFDVAAVSNQLGSSHLDLLAGVRFAASLPVAEFLARFGDPAAAPDCSDSAALQRAVCSVLTSAGLAASAAQLWEGRVHLLAHACERLLGRAETEAPEPLPVFATRETRVPLYGSLRR